MIPERDYYLAKEQVRARRAAADAERLVREARREAAEHHASDAAENDAHADEQHRGAFGWLRRLAGAR